MSDRIFIKTVLGMFLATALALPAAGHTKADSSKVTHRIGIISPKILVLSAVP